MQRFLAVTLAITIGLFAGIYASQIFGAAEAGHAPGRPYFAQDGSFHLNGSAFYNDAEADISGNLELLEAVGTSASYTGGVEAVTFSGTTATMTGRMAAATFSGTTVTTSTGTIGTLTVTTGTLTAATIPTLTVTSATAPTLATTTLTGVTIFKFENGATDVTLSVSGANVFIGNLTTSDPMSAGALFNDSGTLKVSTGM